VAYYLGCFNPSGLSYAATTTATGYSETHHKEMPPYILPPVWDYRKFNKNRRPSTPFPNR